MNITIEYPDKETGELKIRPIRVQCLIKSNKKYYLQATCLITNEIRRFIVNDIQMILDEFGKKIDNKLQYLRNNFKIVESIENNSKTKIEIFESINFDKISFLDLQESIVCLTGKSYKKNIKKADFFEKLNSFQIKNTDKDNQKYTLLIVLGDYKAEKSSKLETSLKRRSNGENIKIINEEQFWELFEIKKAS